MTQPVTIQVALANEKLQNKSRVLGKDSEVLLIAQLNGWSLILGPVAVGEMGCKRHMKFRFLGSNS